MNDSIEAVARVGLPFGLEFSVAEAAVALVPVPWEVTCSFRTGTAGAPKAVIEASAQLDLTPPFGKFNTWKRGIALADMPLDVESLNAELRSIASRHIATLEAGEALDPARQDRLNQGTEELLQAMVACSEDLLSDGKIVGILGGEHSVPLGLLQSLGHQYPEGFGILQLDAHADLRPAYMGLDHSHASIFHNALEISAVKKLVQVGTRDVAPSEADRQKIDSRISAWPAAALHQKLFTGSRWHTLCTKIVESLPQQVYISWDIDVLDVGLAPSTGTPVPGGLSFAQCQHLLRCVVDSGRQVIGFDLCEVSAKQGDELDAIVGAHALWNLCSAALASNKG